MGLTGSRGDLSDWLTMGFAAIVGMATVVLVIALIISAVR